MSKEAYYFSHDANARQDEKILMLRADFGWEGYGIYWALVEMMFESGETALHHNKVKGMAVSYNIDIALLEGVINTCINEALFVSDGEKFWSDSLRRRKDKYHEIKKKRSEAGKKGMAKRWANKQEDNTVITNDNTVITKNNKGKERKVKESKNINNYTDQFENWWSYYPRQVEKKKSFKAFEKALGNHSFDILLNGAKGYADHVKKSRTDEKFIKHPTTFLNGESFMDFQPTQQKESRLKGVDPELLQKLIRRDQVAELMDQAKTDEEYRKLADEWEQLQKEVG